MRLLMTELDDADLDELARRLAPRLAGVSTFVDTVGLTTAQAAQHAGLHERTIRRALGAGMLKGHNVAGRWRVERDSLTAWLEAGAPTSAPQTHDNGRPRRQPTTGTAAIAGRQAA